MNATVKLFFETLSQKFPDYKKHLNPPCDPKKFAEIETLIGEQLPEAMRDFYSVTDGGLSNSAMGWYFMPLEEIKQEYNYCTDMMLIDEDESYLFDGNSLEMPVNGDKIKPVRFHKKWLPIITDYCGGNYFSIDFAPQEKGTKGQVMMHSISGDEAAYYDLATSFEDLLKWITNCLTDNSFYYSEEDNNFVTKFSIHGKAYYPLPITTKQKQIFANLTPKWIDYFNFKSNPNYLVQNYEVTILGLQGWSEAPYLPSSFIENDLTPLLLCPRLKTLSLFERDNYSIDILPELLQLIYLLIYDVNQKDIEVIGNISSLWSLNIRTKNVTDLSALAKLSNLHILTISSDEEINFSHLNGLNKLRSLSVSSDKKIDFSYFVGLNELRTLSVSSSEKLDLTPLQYLPKFSSLDGSALTDLSVLLPLKQLKNLSLLRPMNINQPDYSRGYYENWETIKELKNLRTLNFCNSNFTDLSLVVDLPKLKDLDIRQCEIADFSLLTSIKQKMFLNITLDQFFEAHLYIDKEKITLPYIQTSGRTDEEKAFLAKWFAK